MKCEKNLEACSAPCGNYVCDKRLFGAGKCVDKATFCPKLIVSTNCLLKNGDADCRDGTPGCQNYFCHPDKLATVIGSGKCELGSPPATLSETPTPIPTKVPPLPPCAEWVYAFPTNSPDFRLNNIVIPTGNPEYVNPNFKTRKCIGINTAIGEISTEPQGFVKRIFSLVLGVAGGIALILIIISGYRFMASQGNPEAITNARQQLIAAIVGLLFIIFSFVILQIIGVDILRIPGFAK